MPKKPGPGRPTDYRPEYCEQLIEHMSGGLSFETFAAVIGKHRDTLFHWVTEHPDWAEAKDIAFLKCQLYWEKLGRDNVISESTSESDSEGNRSSSTKSLNPSVWIFNMKNRFKWRDKQPEEVSDVNINVASMSDEELKKLVKEYAEEK